MTTDKIIPIKKGCKVVAYIIKLPSAFMAFAIYGPIVVPINTPTKTVTAGVTKISTFVSLETNFPHYVATKTDKKAPAGPPTALPAAPVTTDENKTKGGALSA